ncbi:MAG: IS1634 family transposase, partial [Candidatus Omnitrophica bacterium]|nr:IS1634 family transposase [Candidatus Omnitrophota bacterium]
FGDVFVGLLLWKKLELDSLFNKLQVPGREDIEWKAMFCLSVLARLCAPSSELAIAERWCDKTVLKDMLGIPVEKINDDRLYRTLDHIINHKDDVCKHLQDRYRDLFGTEFEFLLYDVTSTYFEGLAKKNKKAKRGYSRDHRPDCLQVCIGLVVSKEGLPVGYEVFAGNRADVTTLDEIVELLENKYGKASRIWAFDRGVASEDNIAMLKERGISYVVGTPKGMLKKFAGELHEKNWGEVEPDIEVKIIRTPLNHNESFVLCRSEGRREKERAIIENHRKKLEAELTKVQTAIRKGRLKDVAKAAERIGRWRGKYTRAEKLFDVEFIKDNAGELIDCVLSYKKEHSEWSEKSSGAYLLRTNLTKESPERLWKIYMQLSQAENAFRTSKDELGLRPIYHQIEQRVEAHIFICFLTLALWRTLELWAEKNGLGRSPRKLLDEFTKIKSMDIVIPIKDRPAIRLMAVSKPDQATQILLHKMGIRLPNRTLFKENVVEKNGVKNPQPIENKQLSF